MSADWETLLSRLDYHARTWYENDGGAWLKIHRNRAMQIILGLGYSPDKIMKQFSYRDSESHSRYRDTIEEKQLKLLYQ